MSLLNEIDAKVRQRLAERKAITPLAELRARVAGQESARSLRKALVRKGFCVIAEHKCESPTGGEMDRENLANCIAAYDATSWIAAISVLTESDYFKGSLEQLRSIRKQTNKPILLKDFVVDEYQLWEARASGADAVLLMASLHKDEPSRLTDLHGLASEIGLSTLVELGMSEGPMSELARILPPKADIIGINCRQFDSRRSPLRLRRTVSSFLLRRNLFRRDLQAKASLLPELHAELRSFITSGKLTVAESGVANAKQLQAIRDAEYSAALIGTAFLKGPESVQNRIEHFNGSFNPHRSAQKASPARRRPLVARA